MIIKDVMAEIAVRLRTIPSVTGRTYDWPPGSITPPAAVVSYPAPGTYDISYQRGADRTAGEVLVLIGRPTDKATRDAVTGYIDGAGTESVKAAVDGDGTYTSCDSVTVTGWDVDVVEIGGTPYLAAMFTLDIVGRGTE